MSDSVEVAATVKTEVARGVDVPMPKWKSPALELRCRSVWESITSVSE